MALMRMASAILSVGQFIVVLMVFDFKVIKKIIIMTCAKSLDGMMM
jgi:hypothetical protein